MAYKIARLLPGRGVDLSYIDDRALQGNPLRGCDNVRLVDGEWWTREGEATLRGNALEIPPSIITTIDYMAGNEAFRRHFLIGSDAVIEVNVDDNGVGASESYSYSIPYTESWTGTVSFTNGSTTATYTTTSAAGSSQYATMIYGLDEDGNQAIYFTQNAPSTATGIFTLKSAYKGPTNASYSSKGFVGPDANPAQRTINKAAYAVFRQRTAYTLGQIWGGSGGSATAPFHMNKSPVLAAGGVYLIWSPGIKPSTGRPVGPYLIRLDATETLKGEFMRRTSQTTPASFTGGNGVSAGQGGSRVNFMAVHRDRLIVVREDENASNDDRTIWYSTVGNLMQWHNGTAGGSPPATENNIKITEGQDPITGLAPLGDALVVHRLRSQLLLRPTGSAAFPPGPYTLSYNDQGIGCINQRTLINVRGIHMFVSEYGPMQFDGQQCTPLDGSVRRVSSALLGTSEWAVADASGVAFPDNLHAVYHASRAEVWFSLPTLSVVSSWESLGGDSRYLIYNLETREMSVVRYRYMYVLGTFRSAISGREIIVGARGRAGDAALLQLTQTKKVFDRNLSNPFSTAVADLYPVTSYVETKWHNFESESEKEIIKIEIDLRSYFPSLYVNENGIGLGDTDVVTTDNAFYFLEIYTDHRVNTAYGSTPSGGSSVAYDGDPTYIQQFLVTPAQLGIGHEEGIRMCPAITLVPKVRLQGNLFKFRLRNSGPYDLTGFTPIGRCYPFRLSQITVYYEERESQRRERLP